MAINANRALVVFNTSVAQSEANADAYAAARGLLVAGSYVKMGFPLGTASQVTSAAKSGTLDSITCAKSLSRDGTTNAYVGQQLLTAIATAAVDNACECVLVESACPVTVDGFDMNSTYGDIGPFESFCAGAPIFAPESPSLRALAQMTGLTGKTAKNLSVMSGNVALGCYPVSPLQNRFNAANYARFLPSGRIGFYGCSAADVARIVSDSVWAEGQTNLSKYHLVGGDTYSPNQSAADNVTANAIFASTGIGSVLRRLDVDTQPEYAGTAISKSAYESGALSLNLFGLLYSNGSQSAADYQPGGGIYGSVSVQRGAWGFVWQSSAFLLANMLMAKGAAAAIANVREPYANGLPGIVEVAVALVAGLSVMESVYLSAAMTAPRTTVYGDPLYRPYTSTCPVAAEIGNLR